MKESVNSSMSLIKRVVFDTSTLVSAALRVDSVPSQAFGKALSSGDICASEETLSELEAVLSRSKFNRYLEPGERTAFIELYKTCAPTFDVRETTDDCRDPKDNKFLALAV